MALIPSEQKFHTLDKDTPTKDRGSRQAQALRKIYTMGDVVTTVAANIGVVTTNSYDTVAAMVASSSTAGDVVETSGYFSEGDEGGMFYDIASTGVADGGSVIALANGTYALARFKGTLSPTMWGVKANDSAASTANVASFNAMTLWLSTLGQNVPPNAVLFPQGRYYIDGTVYLPIGYLGATYSFIIDFNGSEIVNNGGTDFVMLHRDMDNRAYAPLVSGATTTAQNLQYYVSENLQLSNLKIKGNSKNASSVGIQLEATSRSSLTNINCNTHGYGLSIQHGLETLIELCLFQNYLEGVWISNGTALWGSTAYQNQSNASTFSDCRWYSAVDTECALRNEGNSGVRVTACVFEGSPPQYNIIASGSSWAQSMVIETLHLETTTEGVCSIAVKNGMSVYISDFYPQNAHVLAKLAGHADGAGAGSVDMQLVYFPPTSTFDLGPATTTWTAADGSTVDRTAAATLTLRGPDFPSGIMNYNTGTAYYTGGVMPYYGQYIRDGLSTQIDLYSAAAITLTGDGITLKQTNSLTSESFNNAPAIKQGYYDTRLSHRTTIAGAFRIAQRSNPPRIPGTPCLNLLQPTSIASDFNVWLPSDQQRGTLAMYRRPQGQSYDWVSPTAMLTNDAAGLMIDVSISPIKTGVKLQDSAGVMFAYIKVPYDVNYSVWIESIQVIASASTASAVNIYNPNITAGAQGGLRKSGDLNAVIDMDPTDSAVRIKGEVDKVAQVTITPGDTTTVIYGIKVIYAT
jgi:hypothetical protein